MSQCALFLLSHCLPVANACLHHFLPQHHHNQGPVHKPSAPNHISSLFLSIWDLHHNQVFGNKWSLCIKIRFFLKQLSFKFVNHALVKLLEVGYIKSVSIMRSEKPINKSNCHVMQSFRTLLCKSISKNLLNSPIYFGCVNPLQCQAPVLSGQTNRRASGKMTLTQTQRHLTVWRREACPPLCLARAAG